MLLLVTSIIRYIFRDTLRIDSNLTALYFKHHSLIQLIILYREMIKHSSYTHLFNTLEVVPKNAREDGEHRPNRHAPASTLLPRNFATKFRSDV